MHIRFYYVGTATALLEIDGLKLLTDPALDSPGTTYRFGWGARSTRTLGAAPLPDGWRPDVVLVSHDQHADNLDAAGRSYLTGATVITTRPGAHRLGSGAVGLAAWQSHRLHTPSGLGIEITATPARHGPPLSRPFVGPVIGFALTWPGQLHGALYLSGDTVWFGGIAQVASRLSVGTAFLHLGSVGFSHFGPLRFTFDSHQALRAARALDPRTIVPLHFEGWTHFREPRASAEQAFAAADLAGRVRWPEPGQWIELEV